MRVLILLAILLLPLAASSQVPPIRVTPHTVQIPNDAIRPSTLEGIEAPSYIVYVYERGGVQSDLFSGAIPMFDPSASGGGRFAHVSSVGWDAAGRLDVRETRRRRAVDAGYIHTENKGFSKFILGRGGRTIGLLTLAEGRSFVFRLDFDQDGVVDIMGVHDAGIGRISHVVRDREDTMRQYEELLAGRATFCSNRTSSTPAPEAAVPFGVGVRPGAQIDACDNANAKLSRLRLGAGSLSSGSQNDVIDSFCSQVLASASSAPGNSTVAQPPASRGSASPRTGHNLGRAIAEVGADLQDIGRAAGGGGPGGAVVAAPLALIGSGLRLLGAGIDALSSEPIPGEEPAYDWAPYCRNRAKENASWDLDAIHDRIAEKDCGDPREATGPNEPRSPRPLADRNCREPERYDDFEGLLTRLRGPACTPDTRAGAQGGCSNAGVPASGVKLDVRYADIAPPNAVSAFEEDILPRVVNPPRSGQLPSRDDDQRP